MRTATWLHGLKQAFVRPLWPDPSSPWLAWEPPTGIAGNPWRPTPPETYRLSLGYPTYLACVKRAMRLKDRYDEADVAAWTGYVAISAEDVRSGTQLPLEVGQHVIFPSPGEDAVSAVKWHDMVPHAGFYGLFDGLRPWPGRLFQVGRFEELTTRSFIADHIHASGNCRAYKVLAELPAAWSFGPQGALAIALAEAAAELDAEAIEALGDLTASVTAGESYRQRAGQASSTYTEAIGWRHKGHYTEVIGWRHKGHYSPVGAQRGAEALVDVVVRAWIETARRQGPDAGLLMRDEGEPIWLWFAFAAPQWRLASEAVRWAIAATVWRDRLGADNANVMLEPWRAFLGRQPWSEAEEGDATPAP